MTPTDRSKVSSRRSTVLGSAILLAGFAACGSGSADHLDGAAPTEAGGPVDAPFVGEAGRWPAEVMVSTCEDHASVTVGSYVVQANYWGKSLCPGTQCMEINKATAAFTVTQGPDACGDTVATYPNVLYGCSWGNCSPASILPMQVSALSTVTSSWDFGVGGAESDRWNVSYDIWFCPDEGCGANGFPGGAEMMIWLDYKNVRGWKTDLGPVTLAGHTFEVWHATMGSEANSWTYLAYVIAPPMVTSVKDLDLAAFVRDAVARGYVQDSWYMYAIQAGPELRTGGVPYDSNSFSVSINGVTPTTEPVPTASPSCDGGVPTAEGTLAVSDDYVTAGPLHGYAAAWSWVGAGSSAIACVSPTCTAPGSLQITAIVGNGVSPLTAEPVSCTPAFAPSALCTSGTLTADASYQQVAGVGFNLNQDLAVDGGASGVLGTVSIGSSITVSVEQAGSLAGNSNLRVQLTDASGNFYCHGGKLRSGVPISVAELNTKCWDNTGEFATSSTPFRRLDVIVPGSASTEEPFSFCLTGVLVE